MVSFLAASPPGPPAWVSCTSDFGLRHELRCAETRTPAEWRARGGPIGRTVDALDVLYLLQLEPGPRGDAPQLPGISRRARGISAIALHLLAFASPLYLAETYHPLEAAQILAARRSLLNRLRWSEHHRAMYLP